MKPTTQGLTIGSWQESDGWDIPSSIKSIIAGKKYQMDTIGMSASKVMIFRDMVLKIQPEGNETDNEYKMMKWLGEKSIVPRILAYEIQNNMSYLLMSKISGRMSCDISYMKNPHMLMQILTDGLKLLWSIDVTECPCNNMLDVKLRQAKYNVDNGLVDVDNVEPETFSEEGFKDPEELLEWLYDNRPEEEIVLSHGDYCLPNIFAKEDSISGFIDLGRMGKADKWQDIALCYRSLKHNYEGKYVVGIYGDIDFRIFFKKLGVEPDWNKIKYYILLDELF